MLEPLAQIGDGTTESPDEELWTSLLSSASAALWEMLIELTKIMWSPTGPPPMSTIPQEQRNGVGLFWLHVGSNAEECIALVLQDPIIPMATLAFRRDFVRNRNRNCSLYTDF